MARVLCAWEFGGDLGHVRTLLPVARELRAMGHVPIFAFRDSAFLEMVLAEGFEAFVAPILRAPVEPNLSPLNFSDVLLNLGFEDPHGLAGALRAWRSLFALVGADFLVADYAPSAMLAARAAGLPRASLGIGFAIPRLESPLPALRSWAPVDSRVLRALDDRLVASIGSAMSRDAGRAPATARDLFDASAHLVCTFEALDPFGPRQGVEYLGPPDDGASGFEVQWPARSRPRVFAYLKPRDARFAQLLGALGKLDADVIVAAPGLAPESARAAATASMQVVPGPVSLDGVLDAADLCVCHAGAGLTARALVAGVPLALAPMQLEQSLIALRLQGLGSAAVIAPGERVSDALEGLSAILAREDLRAAARSHAQAHAGYSFGDAARRAARRIDAMARA